MEDPDSDNSMHRIHKSMKNCTIKKTHYEKEAADPLMCRECKRTAKTSEALECHMTSVHGMSVKVLKCNLCEEEFNSYYDFEGHKRKHERNQSLKLRNKENLKSLVFNDDRDIEIEDDSDDDPSWEKTKEDEQLLKEDEEQLEFQCEQCDFDTMSKEDLSHHVQLKHNSFKDFLKSKGLPILFDFDKTRKEKP